jgi:hypothetical protein
LEHPYNVRRVHDRKWIVSADGRDVLVCGRLRDALAAARDADELLGECLGRRGTLPAHQNWRVLFAKTTLKCR